MNTPLYLLVMLRYAGRSGCWRCAAYAAWLSRWTHTRDLNRGEKPLLTDFHNKSWHGSACVQFLCTASRDPSEHAIRAACYVVDSCYRQKS
jgi:hypothetical protein